MTSSPARSPRTRTGTSYAVLGLLSVQGWTTYELAKQVQRSLNWFWPRAERKLYDEPKALVAEGLAAATPEYTGQRPRTMYEITDAGRAALTAWLDEPAAPRSVEFEAMVKIFFSDAGSRAQLLENLRRVEAEALERLDELVAMVRDQRDAGARFPERGHIGALTLRMQFDQDRALVRWSRWAVEQVEQWRSTTDAGAWDERAVLGAILRDHATLVRQGA